MRIRLDICTICNLNCPACAMRQLNYGELKAGYTTFEVFKKFIDDNSPLVTEIEISNFGEPFLNPDLEKILEYAHLKNIKIFCNNGSNFNSLTDSKIKAIVDYQVQSITFACDGSSQEIYSAYRRNGKIDIVFENVKKIQEYKKQTKSQFPILNWQYIIREGTEQETEISRAKKIAKELGVEIVYKLTWEKKFKPQNSELLKKLTGLNYVSRQEVINKTGVEYKHLDTCTQLWMEPAINWDGRLLGCCSNKHPFNINVFEVGLAKALLSPEYLAAQELVHDGKDSDINIPCNRCLKDKKIKKYLNMLLDPNIIINYRLELFNYLNSKNKNISGE